MAARFDSRILQAETDRRLNCFTDASLCATKKFPYKPEKREVDLYEDLAFFSSVWGDNLGGRLIRAVDLYVSIYGNQYLTDRVLRLEVFNSI